MRNQILGILGIAIPRSVRLRAFPVRMTSRVTSPADTVRIIPAMLRGARSGRQGGNHKSNHRPFVGTFGPIGDGTARFKVKARVNFAILGGEVGEKSMACQARVKLEAPLLPVTAIQFKSGQSGHTGN